jgi:hypothetical protein
VRWVREAERLSSEERARLVLVALRSFALDVPDWVLDEVLALGTRWSASGADKQEALALIQELFWEALESSASAGELERAYDELQALADDFGEDILGLWISRPMTRKCESSAK